MATAPIPSNPPRKSSDVAGSGTADVMRTGTAGIEA
jgi:hypothetical protein